MATKPSVQGIGPTARLPAYGSRAALAFFLSGEGHQMPSCL